MKENKTKPDIRFEAFTEAWEQRKLGDVANRFDNLRIPVASNLRVSGLTPYYGANGIQDYVEGYTHDGEFVLIAEDGANDLKNYPVYYVNGRIWVNNHAHVLQGIEKKCHNSFLAYNICQLDIEPFLVGGGRAKLNADVMMKLYIYLPKFDEQTKIGQYFLQLDNLITLHQRECDQLKELKKSMLKKLFPRNGSNIPEVRFAGFTDAWEQRKLDEVAKYRNGKAHENNITRDGKYIVVNSKFVSTNGEVKKFSNKQIEPLYKNEIAFVLSDVPNGRAIARTFLVEENDKYTLNQRIAGITPAENTNSYFLHILMNRNKYFLKFDDGAKQTNLSVKDVMNFEEKYPCYSEQKKIGLYFEQLDSLITLHQRELEILKNLKKTCLKRMFI